MYVCILYVCVRACDCVLAHALNLHREVERGACRSRTIWVGPISVSRLLVVGRDGDGGRGMGRRSGLGKSLSLLAGWMRWGQRAKPRRAEQRALVASHTASGSVSTESIRFRG